MKLGNCISFGPAAVRLAFFPAGEHKTRSWCENVSTPTFKRRYKWTVSLLFAIKGELPPLMAAA
jgi:hypothetical protein